MEHIANFVKGLAMAGSIAAVLVSSVALPFWFAWWISGGAIWGLPLCIVLMAPMLGGSFYAIHEAVKPRTKI